MSEIRTYSGIMFDPLSPEPALIRIEDIAHALSMLCRANGHFKTFHSVGQHSLECLEEARVRGCSRRVQLACLLHDASEAYLSDVTRPVKHSLPGYLAIEEPLQNTIWNKWISPPLSEEEKEQVFEIDDVLLYHEFFSMTGVPLSREEPQLYSKPDFSFLPFQQCEEEFIRQFHSLILPSDPQKGA